MVCKGKRTALRISFFVFVNHGGEIKARDFRKGHYLIIDSSTIGMESARNYQSTKTTYRHFSLTEYRGGSLSFDGNGPVSYTHLTLPTMAVV